MPTQQEQIDYLIREVNKLRDAGCRCQDCEEEAPQTSSYTVYAALITQSGTDAPVATILENTLSGEIIWSRNSTGSYRGLLTGEFPLNSVAMFTGGQRTFPDTTIRTGRSNDNEVFITTNFQSGTLDSILQNTFVEIRVYPTTPIIAF